jgi:hypothetical protein
MRWARVGVALLVILSTASCCAYQSRIARGRIVAIRHWESTHMPYLDIVVEEEDGRRVTVDYLDPHRYADLAIGECVDVVDNSFDGVKDVRRIECSQIQDGKWRQ